MLSSYQTIVALGRYISFPPRIANEIGIEETIFLLNIAYSASAEDRWVCCSSDELQQKTSLSYKQQARVRARLVQLELLEEKSNRQEHLMYYAVNEEKFNDLMKRQFAELTFGRNSTLPKGSTITPKGSFVLREEVKKELREEESAPPLSESPNPEPTPARPENLGVSQEELAALRAGSKIRPWDEIMEGIHKKDRERAERFRKGIIR